MTKFNLQISICNMNYTLLFLLILITPVFYAYSAPPVIKERTETEMKLLQELETRRIELDRREEALELRERLVDLAGSRLGGKVERLEQLERSISKLLKNLSGKEEEELTSLARIYEAMKPASAATVLNKTDNRIVFDIFKRMKRKNVAKIMEKMSPQKARIISEMLAEKAELPQFE